MWSLTPNKRKKFGWKKITGLEPAYLCIKNAVLTSVNNLPNKNNTGSKIIQAGAHDA
jgi:hypothetical protein